MSINFHTTCFTTTYIVLSSRMWNIFLHSRGCAWSSG